MVVRVVVAVPDNDVVVVDSVGLRAAVEIVNPRNLTELEIVVVVVESFREWASTSGEMAS